MSPATPGRSAYDPRLLVRLLAAEPRARAASVRRTHRLAIPPYASRATIVLQDTGAAPPAG